MKKEILFLMLFVATLYGSDAPKSCIEKILLGLQKAYTYSTILAVQSAKHPFDVRANFQRTGDLYGGIYWDGRIAYSNNPAYFEANGMPNSEAKK